MVDLQPAYMEDRRGEPITWVDYNHYMRPANKLTLFLGLDHVHQHYKPDADDALDHHDQMEKLWCTALNVDMDDRHLLKNIKLDATDFFAVQAINVAGRGYYRSKDRIYMLREVTEGPSDSEEDFEEDEADMRETAAVTRHLGRELFVEATSP